jgi:Arc/MetJ family transcription regulator
MRDRRAASHCSDWPYTHKHDVYTHQENILRTNIDIDERLMRQAMRHGGARTKKGAVEAGLRLIVKTHAQGSIRRLRGRVRWAGELRESPLGRVRG